MAYTPRGGGRGGFRGGDRGGRGCVLHPHPICLELIGVAAVEEDFEVAVEADGEDLLDEVAREAVLDPEVEVEDGGVQGVLEAAQRS